MATTRKPGGTRSKAKEKTANLDDLKGDGLEEAKPILEGDYQKKASD